MSQKPVALIGSSRQVKEGTALAKSEHELYEAMSGAFESFYAQGVILNRINVEQEYKDAGFDSFADYMNERQPCGITASQSYRLIAAMKLRPLLPDFRPLGESENKNSWSERAIRPLLHKDFTPADQKRLGKKIATKVKNGEKLTAALVKEICDADRGVDQQKREKKRQELKVTKTAAETLLEMELQIQLWMQALENVSGEFWSDAEEDDPGCGKRLSKMASKFASFLLG
jgi:hypothetical protein